jgi:hypothetical protein
VTIEALILLSAAVLLSGLLATILFCVGFRRSFPDAAPSFVRYFATAAALAITAYFVGSAMEIYGGCRSPKSGNLCGIWGALIVGPMLSGAALWAYGFFCRSRLMKSPGQER